MGIAKEPELTSWAEKLKRPCSMLNFEFGKTSDDPTANVFGEVRLMDESEDWPTLHGEPLCPLFQINLSELPFRLQGLGDISFISFFVRYDYYRFDTHRLANAAQGVDTPWCLRTYSSLSNLVEVEERPRHKDLNIVVSEGQWSSIKNDFPTHDLLPSDFPAELIDPFYENFSNLCGFKIGGWPSCIQSPPWWEASEMNSEGAGYKYLIQVCSVLEANWMWGDSGNAFFARLQDQQSDWAFEWQSH